jgi:biopolymer transport protein ExbB
MSHRGAFRSVQTFLTLLLLGSSIASAQEPDAARKDAPAAAKAAEAPPAGEPAPEEAAPPAAPAAPAPAQPAPAQRESLLLWIYKAEGIFFFPQLAMSIVLVAMIVLYSMQVSRKEFMPAALMDGIENNIKEKKFQEAYDLAKTDESLIGRLVTAGIVRFQTSGGQYPQALEAMQEVGEDDGMKFDHRLSYLAMLANIATMVGLLGTVWGMVAAFMVIAQSDTSPKPSELAQGVSQALVTTVWGLLQAIPAVVAHTILKNRISRMMLETGIAAERIVGRFPYLGKGSKPIAGGPPAESPKA